MRKGIVAFLTVGVLGLSLTGCTSADAPGMQSLLVSTAQGNQSLLENASVVEGTEIYRGFRVDNVLHAGEYGDIHYHVMVPEDYDGIRLYALYLTLPGYEGL